MTTDPLPLPLIQCAGCGAAVKGCWICEPTNPDHPRST